MEITVKDLETNTVYQTNPVRDVAFFIPQLIKDVEKRITAPVFDSDTKARLDLVFSDEKEARDCLAKCFISFSCFFTEAARVGQDTPAATIEAVHWNLHPPVCRQIILEKFAMSVMGAVWTGLKSSVIVGKEPLFLSHLQESARKLLDSIENKV